MTQRGALDTGLKWLRAQPIDPNKPTFMQMAIGKKNKLKKEELAICYAFTLAATHYCLFNSRSLNAPYLFWFVLTVPVGETLILHGTGKRIVQCMSFLMSPKSLAEVEAALLATNALE